MRVACQHYRWKHGSVYPTEIDQIAAVSLAGTSSHGNEQAESPEVVSQASSQAGMEEFITGVANDEIFEISLSEVHENAQEIPEINISDTSVEEIMAENSENAPQTLARKTRKSYETRFKMNVLDYAETHREILTDRDVARFFGISSTLVGRWKKCSAQIQINDKIQRLKSLRKIRKSKKHDVLFKKLSERFLNARARGRKVSHVWLWRNGRQIHREMSPWSSNELPRSAIAVFVSRYNLKIRKRQRAKSVDKEAFRQKMIQWHVVLRERVIRSGSPTDEKCGKFPPHIRFNVDQVPLPFAIDCTQTYERSVSAEDRNNHKVWITQPGSGLDKRQCTLQLCFQLILPAR